MAVAEEIPVLAVAGGALDHPGPRAVLALAKREVGGLEERARGIIDEGPAGARDDAGLHGLAGLVAVGAVESACGAHQVLVVGQAGAPDVELVAGIEVDGQVIGAEAAVLVGLGRVGEAERRGLDGEASFVVGDGFLKVGRRQAAVDKDEAGVIFEFAVRGPFHADELAGEDGETRFAEGDDGLWIGDGIVGLVRRRWRRERVGIGGYEVGFCSGVKRVGGRLGARVNGS